MFEQMLSANERRVFSVTCSPGAVCKNQSNRVAACQPHDVTTASRDAFFSHREHENLK